MLAGTWMSDINFFTWHSVDKNMNVLKILFVTVIPKFLHLKHVGNPCVL